MAVTLIGLVFYADDPEKKIFRRVYPSHADSELVDARWLTEGTDPVRQAMMIRAPIESELAKKTMIGAS